MTATWCRLHLRGDGNAIDSLQTSLNEVSDVWRHDGIRIWGRFAGLFGLASNELLVMLYAEDDRAEVAFRNACGDGIEVLECLRLEATLRPKSFAPLERPGIYVFRTFRVPGTEVDRVVELSGGAWATFELGTAAAATYRAEPQGLFREKAAGHSEDQDVLLLTWYDDLTSWERSRTPDPAATARFRERHSLTRHTLAVATRLIV